MVIFARMYTLMTLFTMALAFLHIQAKESGQTTSRLSMIFLITFFGVMTHYYFAVIAFCFAGAYCIYRLVRKEYKQMLVYGLLELMAVALVFVVYPAAVTQITGSETNNVGKEVAATFFSLSGWGKSILRYIWQIIGDWSRGLRSLKLITIGLLIASGSALVWVCAAKKIRENSAESKDINGLLRVFAYMSIPLAAVVIIAKASNKFVYTRYMYNLIPLFVLAVTMLISWGCLRWKVPIKVVACIIVAVSLASLVGTVVNQRSAYLFQERKEQLDKIQMSYGDVPVVLLCEYNEYVLTGNYTFLKQYSNVYVTSADNLTELDAVLDEKDTTKGFLCLIWTDQVWANGYESQMVLKNLKKECKYYSEPEHFEGIYFCDAYYFSA